MLKRFFEHVSEIPRRQPAEAGDGHRFDQLPAERGARGRRGACRRLAAGDRRLTAVSYRDQPFVVEAAVAVGKASP